VIDTVVMTVNNVCLHSSKAITEVSLTYSLCYIGGQCIKQRVTQFVSADFQDASRHQEEEEEDSRQAKSNVHP